MLVNLKANDFGGNGSELAYIRALLTFDSGVVQMVSFKRGDWIEGSYSLSQPVENQVRIRVDASSAAQWKAAAASSSGCGSARSPLAHSRVDFLSGTGYTGGYNDVLGGLHGGTLSVK